MESVKSNGWSEKSTAIDVISGRQAGDFGSKNGPAPRLAQKPRSQRKRPGLTMHTHATRRHFGASRNAKKKHQHEVGVSTGGTTARNVSITSPSSTAFERRTMLPLISLCPCKILQLQQKGLHLSQLTQSVPSCSINNESCSVSPFREMTRRYLVPSDSVGMMFGFGLVCSRREGTTLWSVHGYRRPHCPTLHDSTTSLEGVFMSILLPCDHDWLLHLNRSN